MWTALTLVVAIFSNHQSPHNAPSVISISISISNSISITIFISFSLYLLHYIYAANSANLGTAGYVFIAVLVFALVLILLFRPLFWRLVIYVEAMNSRSMNEGLFCLTLILVFLCAWATALVGLGQSNYYLGYFFVPLIFLSEELQFLIPSYDQ